MWRAGLVDQGAQARDQGVGLTVGEPGQRCGQQVHAEDLPVAAQRFVTDRGEPDQRPPPVGRVALALQQALVLQVADDLADHGLGPAQVPGGLADGQRPGHGQVLQHGP